MLVSATLSTQVVKLATIALHQPVHVGFEGADTTMKAVPIEIKNIGNEDGTDFNFDSDDDEPNVQRQARIAEQATQAQQQ